MMIDSCHSTEDTVDSGVPRGSVLGLPRGGGGGGGGVVQKRVRALISVLHKNHIFQCMGKIFCVEFQRVPLKFHTKYLGHTLKHVDFIRR